MKNLFKISLVIIIQVMYSGPVTQAQSSAYNQADSAAVTLTALDYIDGYYSGDVVRMENAIHPDLNKVTPRT